MQQLFILGIWLSYIGLGLRAPFVFGLGYIWIDFFIPQAVAPSVMGSVPASLVIGLGCVLGYLVADRRAPPRISGMLVLTLVWALWITLTTIFAELPEPAWEKWDWAVKTVLISAFLPFLFRSRVHIEAAVLTIVLSVASNTIPFAIKTAITGGGYERPLGLLKSNSALGEGSILAVITVACIPLVVWLRTHSQLIPQNKLTRLGYLAAFPTAILGALGTYARSGLVAMAVLAAYSWWLSKRKVLLAIVFVAGGLAGAAFMGSNWSQRMSTIETPEQESSANGRLLVWQWTMDYVAQHPLGGGFEVWRKSYWTDERPDGTRTTIQGRAFHSIWFEALGEHGYPGLAIFLSLIGLFYWNLWGVTKQTKGIAELAWLRDLARWMMVSAAVYLVGSSFVATTFAPYQYYLFALSVSMSEYLVRVRAGITVAPTGRAEARRGGSAGWRDQTSSAAAAAGVRAAPESWRGRFPAKRV